MRLGFSEAENELRTEARAFFRDEYPQDIKDKVRRGVALTREDHVSAQRALHSRGWLAASWPRELGGTGWTPTERYIFEEEGEMAGMAPLNPIGLIYIGPIICAFGTSEQKERWLQDILESRTFWAQGYSEPDAGSDLANVRMIATRTEDGYVLDGTKTWTSYAQYADWIFCLVRTSKEGRRQDGLSLVCLDLRSPGITLEPIASIEGQLQLNRVTFDQVCMPANGLIGEEGKGWHYATVLLQNERLSYAHMGKKKADLDTLQNTLDRHGNCDPELQRKVATAKIDLAVLEISALRAMAGEMDSAAVSGLKIGFTELAQRISELELECSAQLARRDADAGTSAASYLFHRAGTIYGGTTEIQKTVIWRSLAHAHSR